MSARKHSSRNKLSGMKRSKFYIEQSEDGTLSEDQQVQQLQTPDWNRKKRPRVDIDSRKKFAEEHQIGAEYSSLGKQSSTNQDDEEDHPDKVTANSVAGSTMPTSFEITMQQHSMIQQGPTFSKEFDENHIKTETQYLNLQNLKKLERISECVKLNFGGFIKQMIEDERVDCGNSQAIDIFKKKPEINIGKLQARSQHIIKNKTSDKFNRRDVQFYDLYVKRECGEELAKLKDNAFPLDINAEQYYEELEVDDFNKLFYDNQLIENKFGQSIKVEISVEGKTLVRKVIEDAAKVVVHDKKDFTSPQKSPSKKQVSDQDPELQTLDVQLKQFEKEYCKSSDQVADAYCKVSGRLNKMKDYFENRPVVEWNYLEDLALTKPDESPEFQVLLQTKGFEEIKARRYFLQATPIITEEEKK